MSNNLPPDDPKMLDNKNNLGTGNNQQFKCPSCRSVNPIANKFCNSCGIRLVPSSHSINNDKASKACPKCNNRFPNNVNYCLFDGTQLQEIQPNQSPIVSTNSFQKQKNPINESLKTKFSGFEIPFTHNPHSPIPIDLIRTTTNLLVPSLNIPTSIKNVKSTYWSVSAPKKSINPLIKWIDHVGFSRNNLMAYLVISVYVAIIYYLWYLRDIEFTALQLEQYVPNNQLLSTLIFGGITISISLFILILPVISLGYTSTKIVQANRQDFQLKLEPTLFILTLLLNGIIYYFLPGPLPIILLPAEIKLRGLPPKKEISKSIFRGIIPGIILTFIFVAIYLFATIDQWLGIPPIWYINPIILTNLKILVIFGTGINLLAMLPFGNALGRLIQDYNRKWYYLLFILSIILLLFVFLIPQDYSM